MNKEEKLLEIEALITKYKKRKEEGTLYGLEETLPKIIIFEYLSFVKKPYYDLMSNYEDAFINNEHFIDNNVDNIDVIAEDCGLSAVIDYIKHYDFEKEKFDIFLVSMKIHQLLYMYCKGSEFGGQLRTETAVLKNWTVEVPEPYEAMKYFNSFINNSDFIFENYNKAKYSDYIRDCIKLCVTLTRVQPFADGNKRTFRALLSLLLKRLGIPPIYIEEKEINEYKRVLKKAIEAKSDEDYDEIIQFYLYKICDSIIMLDINKSKYNSIKKTKDNELNIYMNYENSCMEREAEKSKLKILEELEKNSGFNILTNEDIKDEKEKIKKKSLK